ncbi:MAG: hypothetical protein J0I84_03870 [Terrimonas sp.]|uniref:DoxX family protein n=1 Tax=Terrimonas sp. TaxID=1914338 RepID=UPI000ACF98AD|nr:DoxX family protein [Terrimonas sp.]MBN8786201.1 hypothetical protein [Terrimonas sp.]
MTRHMLSRIAVWLLAIVMIVFGVMHFKNPDAMLVYVPLYIPGGIIWVYVVGVAFILVGLAFILNRYVAVAGFILAVLLLLFVLLIHLPNWRDSGDPAMRQGALVNILKDLAIAGFALFIASNAKNQRLYELS